MDAVTLRRRLYAQGLGRATVNDYMRAIQTADDWCRARGWTLNTVPGPVVAQLMDCLPPTYSTQKRYQQALVHYWQATGRRHPPVGAIRLPGRPKGECRALDPDEAAILVKTARAWRDGPEGVAVLAGMYLALRRFEIAKLKWGDFGSDGFRDGRRQRPLSWACAIPSARGRCGRLVAQLAAARTGRQGRQVHLPG